MTTWQGNCPTREHEKVVNPKRLDNCNLGKHCLLAKWTKIMTLCDSRVDIQQYLRRETEYLSQQSLNMKNGMNLYRMKGIRE